MKDYIKRYYKQGVITCCWKVSSGYRELLFAMLEFVPKYRGDEYSIPEQGVKVGSSRLYYIRYVMNPDAALGWYESARSTLEISMPWDSVEKRIYFSDNHVKNTLREPIVWPQTAYNGDAPFRNKLWQGAQMHHIMPEERLRAMEKFLSSDIAISDWIEDRLLWNLCQHLEYLGTLNLVLPNPHYGHMHMRLVPAEDNASLEKVRLLFDRDCSSEGLRIIVQEEKFGEFLEVREFDVPLRNNEFETNGCVDKVGYVVVDSRRRVIDREEPTPFIRKMVVNYLCCDQAKTVSCRDGGLQEISPSVRETSELGSDENIPELKLRHKMVDIRFSKKSKEEGRDQYIFYQNGGDAERFLRTLIMNAHKDIDIIDPYFSESSIEMFLPHTNHDVDVKVVCTSGGFKEEGSAASFKAAIDKYNTLDRRIQVIVAGHGQLHDRFLIIDGVDVWMLGSSMKSLGDSLSVIVKLKNSVDVIDKLRKTISSFNAPSLDDWLVNNLKSC